MRQFKTAPGVPIGLVCCVVLGLYADAGNTQPTPAGQGQGEIAGTDRQEQIAERDRLKGQASSLERQGRRAKAISASEEALAIERKVLGRRHPDVRASLISLAELYQERDDYASAVQARREIATIEEELLGDSNWRVSEARGWLRLTERLGALNPEDRRRLESQHVEALSFIIISESVYLHDRLVVEAERVLALRRKLLPDLPPLAQSLNTLALLHLAAGDSARALPLFEEALEVTEKTLGKGHPSYGTVLDNLAFLNWDVGNYAKAVPLAERAVEIHRNTWGETHSAHIGSLHMLAVLYWSTDEPVKARAMYRKAAEVSKLRIWNEATSSWPFDLVEWTGWEETFRRLLSVAEQAVDGKPPGRAMKLRALANEYKRSHSLRWAEPLYRQALKATKREVGETHSDYLVVLNELAELTRNLGRTTEAEPLFLKSVELTKGLRGDTHPDVATRLARLADLYRTQREFKKAEPLYRDALRLMNSAGGKPHPDHFATVRAFAEMYEEDEQFAQAKSLKRRAVEVARQQAGVDPNWDLQNATSELVRFLHRRAEWQVKREDFPAARDLYQELLTTDGADKAGVRIALARVDRLSILAPEARHRLESAEQADSDAARLSSQQRFFEAIPLAERAVAVRRELLGDKDPVVIDGLRKLAGLHKAVANYSRALELLTQAVEIARNLHGMESYDYKNLAMEVEQLRKMSNSGFEFPTGRLLAEPSRMDIRLETRRVRKGQDEAFVPLGSGAQPVLLSDGDRVQLRVANKSPVDVTFGLILLAGNETTSILSPEPSQNDFRTENNRLLPNEEWMLEFPVNAARRVERGQYLLFAIHEVHSGSRGWTGFANPGRALRRASVGEYAIRVGSILIQPRESIALPAREVAAAAAEGRVAELDLTARLDEMTGRLAAARDARRKLIEIATAQHGEGHWTVADARRAGSG